MHVRLTLDPAPSPPAPPMITPFMGITGLSHNLGRVEPPPPAQRWTGRSTSYSASQHTGSTTAKSPRSNAQHSVFKTKHSAARNTDSSIISMQHTIFKSNHFAARNSNNSIIATKQHSLQHNVFKAKHFAAGSTDSSIITRQ